MEKYLDITSLIKSDFYKKNQRLSWHISHTEYNKLSSDLNNLLENLEFDKIENEIFQIVKFDIFSSLSQYLSHVYDFILLSRQNIKPIYSRDSNIYIDPIWQKRPIMNTFVLDLQKRRKKNNIFKYCYSKMFKNFTHILFSN